MDGALTPLIPSHHGPLKRWRRRPADAVTNAARREGLTVGQWLERRVTEWEGAGSPMPVSSPAAPVNLGELAQLIEATRALSVEAVVPVPPSIAKDALGMVRLAIRQAKGLPPPARRKPPQLAIEG